MNSSAECRELNATFRPKRLYLYLGLGCFLGFSAWGTFGVWIALTQPGVPSRITLLGIMGGIPLAMTALSALMVAAYYRERLTIYGDRITKQDVFRRAEFDLRDVTEACWRWWPGESGSVRLTTATTRVSIEFGIVERDERSQVIDYLRSAIKPGVQTNWNLFDYKIAARLRRPKPTKPGLNEILLRRDQWDRYMVPGVPAAAVIGVVAWWQTGELRVLAPLMIPILIWVVVRMTTPAEGMITRRLSISANPDTSRWLLFLLFWGMAAALGVITVEANRDRLTHPDTVLVIGQIVWLSILIHEAFRTDRRRSQREREAADIAAKERGGNPEGATLSADDHWSM
jgi:hypothetical protein